jgi:hypothetical protein
MATSALFQGPIHSFLYVVLACPLSSLRDNCTAALGAIIGAIIGIINHQISQRQQDLSSHEAAYENL